MSYADSMWRLVFLVPMLTGCGLLLDTGGLEEAGMGPNDSGVRDSTVMDAPPFDGGPATSDAGAVDAAAMDVVVPPDLPVVTGGYFTLAARAFEAEGGDISSTMPLPWSPEYITFETSEPMDHALLAGRVIGPSGVVTSMLYALDVSPGTTIAFLGGADPPNGWYCLQIHATPAVRGPLLDGDFSGTFPSGDGSEGGDFTYLFAVLRGDANGDRIVDGADMPILGGTDARQDLDADGDVDGDDYLTHQRLIGDVLPPPPTMFSPDACPDATGP